MGKPSRISRLEVEPSDGAGVGPNTDNTGATMQDRWLVLSKIRGYFSLYERKGQSSILLPTLSRPSSSRNGLSELNLLRLGITRFFLLRVLISLLKKRDCSS